MMIKNKYFFAALVMALSMFAAPMNANVRGIYADVNGDREVNIADINAVVDFILSGNEGHVVDLSLSYLSASDFGAVGDGETDDTEALENLFQAAFMLKKHVYFNPGTYLIRRSLLLRSGMEIYGEDATIKKPTAVTTTLAEPAIVDQTYLDVKSASGFNVGDQIVIVDPGLTANKCTYGIITEIDENRISFTNIFSDQQPAFPGCITEYDAGVKVSSSFALLRSWSTRFECDGVYIHDLTLDGNRKSSEPRVWSNSCIHMDSYYPGGYTGSTGIEYRKIQRDMTVRDVNINNSPCDAISDQGEGGLTVRDCVIQNSAMHGVHMGTKFNGAVIAGNKMTGNGSAGSGVFFCQEVYDVIVNDNTITSFNHGCSDEEFGTAGRFITIRSNIFRDIKGYVFDFLKAQTSYRGSGLQISNNYIYNLKSAVFSGDYLDNVIISSNIVSSVESTPSSFVKISDSRNVIISGNKLPDGVEVSTPVNANNTLNLIEKYNSWD